MIDTDSPDTDSPLGLPSYMTGRTVVVDGERYVSLRHVHALFEHTAEGTAFYRVHRKLFTWRRGGGGLMLGEVVREDRPQGLLDREFGPLRYPASIG